jgi:hypothetical protein
MPANAPTAETVAEATTKIVAKIAMGAAMRTAAISGGGRAEGARAATTTAATEGKKSNENLCLVTVRHGRQKDYAGGRVMLRLRGPMNKILLISLCLILAGCGAPRGGRMLTVADTDPLEWRQTVLRVEVNDTLSSRDLSIYIRTDGTFVGGLLPISISSLAPGGEWARDDIEFRLAGHPGNGLHEITVPWRGGVVFPRTGNYTFNITGGPVRGIRAVGIMENGQK